MKKKSKQIKVRMLSQDFFTTFFCNVFAIYHFAAHLLLLRKNIIFQNLVCVRRCCRCKQARCWDELTRLSAVKGLNNFTFIVLSCDPVAYHLFVGSTTSSGMAPSCAMIS